MTVIGRGGARRRDRDQPPTRQQTPLLHGHRPPLDLAVQHDPLGSQRANAFGQPIDQPHRCPTYSVPGGQRSACDGGQIRDGVDRLGRDRHPRDELPLPRRDFHHQPILGLIEQAPPGRSLQLETQRPMAMQVQSVHQPDSGSSEELLLGLQALHEGAKADLETPVGAFDELVVPEVDRACISLVGRNADQIAQRVRASRNQQG